MLPLAIRSVVLSDFRKHKMSKVKFANIKVKFDAAAENHSHLD